MLLQDPARFVKQTTPESHGKDDTSTGEATSATSCTVVLEELRNEGRMLKEFIVEWCRRQEQQCDVLEQGCLSQQQKGLQQPASQGQSQNQSYPQWNPPSKFRANVCQHDHLTQAVSPALGNVVKATSPVEQQQSALLAQVVGNGTHPVDPFAIYRPSDISNNSIASGQWECPRSPVGVRLSEISCPSNWDRVETDESEQHRQQWTKHLKKQVSRELSRQNSRYLGHRCLEPSPILCSVVESKIFQAVCAAAILVNAAFIGYSSDVGMSNALMVPMAEDPQWWRHFNIAFTCFYAIEIAVRICAYRWCFVTGEDKSWNGLDSVLLLLAVAEAASGSGNISSMRVQKGLRMFRVLRVIRVLRFFRDLRMMVCFILQSLTSLCWAMLLLLVIMYLFTALFMQGIVLHFQETPSEIELMRKDTEFWYGSILTTMYTLLAAITGGIDWQEAVVPLENISGLYRGLWSFYVVFVVIGVLNVLTGIFVERACELSGLDRDLVVQSEMKRNESFLVEMKRIFEEVDEHGSGTITWKEFKRYMENPRVQAYFSSKQLDAFDARSLFELFSQDHAEEIGIEEFVIGCQRLKGMARSVDLLAVLREARETKRVLKTLVRRMDTTNDANFLRHCSQPVLRRSFTAGISWGDASEVTPQAMKVHCDI